MMGRKLVCSGVLLIALAAGANAQWRRFGSGDRDDRPPGRGDYRGGLIERVLRDVDSARSYGFTARGERSHLDQARRDLLRFDDRWHEGRFDRGRLDSAIGHIDHLARSRYIDPRERRILERDLWDLRDFRANRGDRRGYESGWRGDR